MKRYELKLIPGGRGVFKISVVDEAAVEADIVKFNEEREEVLTFNNEEKQIFYSVVMRPGIDIPRKNINGEPAVTFYTKETVEQAAINYWRQAGNLSTNINHSDEANATGIFPFESWIVENPETDKSKTLGLQTFAGDWVAGYKVDNKELWDDYVKTGKLNGLSIEATHYKYELIPEIEMKKNKTTEEDKKSLSFMQKVANLLKMESEEDKIEAEAEAKEDAVDEVVIEAAEEAAETPETPETPEAPEGEAVEAEPTEKELVLLQQIADLEAEVADLKAKLIENDTELETMKAQTTSAKAITNLPPAPEAPAKSYEQMTNLEKLEFNRQNKY